MFTETCISAGVRKAKGVTRVYVFNAWRWRWKTCQRPLVHKGQEGNRAASDSWHPDSACMQTAKRVQCFYKDPDTSSYSSTAWNRDHGMGPLLGPSHCTHSSELHYHVSAALLSPFLLLRASIFWACAKSEDRREGGKLTPEFWRHCSQGQSQIQTFWKAVYTEQVNASKWVPKEDLVIDSLLRFKFAFHISTP